MDQPRPGNDDGADGAGRAGRADERLRARLARIDPAAALTPTDPVRVDRLLEDTMSSPHQPSGVTDPTDHPEQAEHPGHPETRATGTRQRSPLTWLVAAAAVVLIAGTAVFALVRHDDDRAGQVPAATGPSTTTLRAPGPAAYQARCLVPTPERLAQQSVAFDATVQSVADGTVTLAPTRFYAGDPTELVRVQAPAADLDELIGAVDLREGGRYLVSANGGQVTVCGFSGAYSERLAGLYAQAFPGGR